MSDELAKEVGFFNVGANNLTQCALAIDSQNAKLDAYFLCVKRAWRYYCVRTSEFPINWSFSLISANHEGGGHWKVSGYKAV